VAAPDSYAPAENRTLVVSAADGVLRNDTLEGAPTAILRSDVSNGILLFNPDGSFIYTPDPDFAGTDSFTYNIDSSGGPQVFIIDQANSLVTVTASVSVPGIGSDTDTDTSSVTGTIAASLAPSAAPFNQIQVTDLDVSLAESVSLSFRFAFGLAGINVSTAPNGIAVSMVTPGPPAPVDGGGNFTQNNNIVAVNGTVDVAATGLAVGRVPEGPQVIAINDQPLDLNGTVTQAGNVVVINTAILVYRSRQHLLHDGCHVGPFTEVMNFPRGHILHTTTPFSTAVFDSLFPNAQSKQMDISDIGFSHKGRVTAVYRVVIVWGACGMGYCDNFCRYSVFGERGGDL
jgi:hypothetical protein